MRQTIDFKKWEIHVPFEVEVIQNHESCPDFFYFAALHDEDGKYTGWMPQVGYPYCPYCGALCGEKGNREDL